MPRSQSQDARSTWIESHDWVLLRWLARIVIGACRSESRLGVDHTNQTQSLRIKIDNAFAASRVLVSIQLTPLGRLGFGQVCESLGPLPRLVRRFVPLWSGGSVIFDGEGRPVTSSRWTGETSLSRRMIRMHIFSVCEAT